MSTRPTKIRDALIIGAGFAGMYGIVKLRELGMDIVAVEAGSDVGGTWYWNRYPGARCDVESMDYSYSFSRELQQEWNWSERYSAQPEILAYAKHVADRFDLRRSIRFGTRITAAQFDRELNQWTATTDQGDTIRSRYIVMAGGCLSLPRLPDFEGRDDFKGRILHTGRWPEEPVSFEGLRVGVIGTGSSGIQVIPQVARSAKECTVFQRTAGYSLPAFNQALDEEFRTWYKANYPQRREKARYSVAGSAGHPVPTRGALEDSDAERTQTYEAAWKRGNTSFLRCYNDILTNAEANETMSAFVRQKIRNTVKDPAVAEMLVPKTHLIGTKRICLDTHYFETFNRENVRLVDLRSNPIVRFTATGIETRSGHHELDAVVFATGYDAMTGALLDIDFAVEGETSLREKWRDGATTYLGLLTAGFPNLFIVTGPGSPSVLANMITGIEQHIEWIADCLRYARENGYASIEADPAYERDWVKHVNQLADATLLPLADSWYLGANIPGKPRVFLPYVGGHGNYRMKCADVAFQRYEGVRFQGARQSQASGDPATPAASASTTDTSPGVTHRMQKNG
jgi:cyclohexanone monooxygenase